MDCQVATFLPPTFARGLHVLLVDHNSICLAFMTTMLQHYSYKVTTAQLASVALSMIWDQNLQFNLVIADVDLPDTNISSFLRLLPKAIPVILISSLRDLKLARKALAEGATYFLEKPISEQDVQYLWQHVYRKIKSLNDLKIEQASYGKRSHGVEIREASVPVGQVESKSKDDRIDPSINKRARIVWSTELNRRFIEALRKLGDEKARPKAILRMLNDPSLTLRQVANHLKKYKAQVQTTNMKYKAQAQSMNMTYKFTSVDVQTMNENWENGGCSSNLQWFNANKSFGVQPEIHAEQRNYGWEEADEYEKKGTPEDQILGGTEQAEGGDCCLNQRQTLKEYADALKELEENLEDNTFIGSEENGDYVDKYCEWLMEEDKDQEMA